MVQHIVASAGAHLPPDPPSADALVRSQRWLDTIQRLYGFSVTTLTVADAAGNLTGSLPVSALASQLTGRRIVSLPFADSCVLLAADAWSANRLLDAAIAFAQDHRARYMELRTGANEILAARPDFVASNLYVRWKLPLSAGLDALFAGLKKPVQRQVRKARRLGVTVRMGESANDMAIYHRLHLRTRTRKHGMPAQSRQFFLDLWTAFAADQAVRLLLAEHEGTPIGGLVLTLSDTEMHVAYAASDERYLHLAPNNLLMWEAIAWSVEHGYQTFDMGRTAIDNPGLMAFKRGWGAIEEPLTYYYYPRVAGLASTPHDSWRYHLLTSTWRHLPLSLADTLSGVLYKHLG